MQDKLKIAAGREFWRIAFVFVPAVAAMAALYGVFGSEAAIVGYFTPLREAHPALTALATWFSAGGNILVGVVYVILLVLGIRRRDPELKTFVLGVLVAFVLMLPALSFAKMAIGRARPLVGIDFRPFSSVGSYHSFPSGHATEASFLALPLARRCGGILVPLALGIFVAVMALSRIYLGRHHPSDILGGLLLGGVAGWAARPIANQLAKRFGFGLTGRAEKH